MHRPIAVCLLLLLLSAPAPADEKDRRIARLEAALSDARSKNEQMLALLEQASAAIDTLSADLTEKQERLVAERVRHEERLALLREEVTALGQRVENVELERDRMRHEFERRMREQVLSQKRLAEQAETLASLAEERTAALEAAIRKLDRRAVLLAQLEQVARRTLEAAEPVGFLAAARALTELGRGPEIAGRLLVWAAAPERSTEETEAVGEVLVTIVEQAAVADDPSIVPSLLAGPASTPRRRAVEEAFRVKLRPGDSAEALWKLCRADTFRAVRVGVATVHALDTLRANAEFADTPAHEAVSFYSTMSSLPWVCLPSARDRTLRFRASEMRIGQLARESLASAGLGFRLWDGILLVGTPEELEALPRPEALLPRVDGLRWMARGPRFEGASMEDVLAFVAEATELSVVPIDPPRPEITVDLAGSPLGMLRIIALVSGARMEYRWGALLVGTEDSLARLGPVAPESVDDDTASGEALERLRATAIPIEVRELPLGEILQSVGKVTKTPVVLANGVDGKTSITLTASTNAEDLLRLLLRPHGLTFRIEKGKITVEPRR